MGDGWPSPGRVRVHHHMGKKSRNAGMAKKNVQNVTGGKALSMPFRH